MKILLNLLIFCLAILAGYCQPDLSLRGKFLSADSVLLVAHESTIDGLTIDDRSSSDTQINDLRPRLIVAGNLNHSIIRQTKYLNIADRKYVLTALDPPKGAYSYTPSPCFDPHHAIVIFKEGHCSYIDFCFTCSNFSYSSDLNADMFAFSWKNVGAVFRKFGLTYMLTKH